ncbi:efflux RND transporter permease subunit [Aureispira anguillae]|uniref:Efflux RND transporter permease subunit n=1 Tax=Aureispira anguillae TaxID=2864201 RepID=A0A916DSH5_9BACT|nr:efflux RND transporter permease subunit [Aureispira anguillae]BDS12534.1 efflux RND transporter permease subunit [Aureispira anguillae]
MKKAIQYFIKYHISADVLLLLIGILGVLSAINIQRSQFPRVESREIVIETTYIGASPSEVEKGITIKIEEEIDGLEGIKKVSSTSVENLSTVNIEIFSSYKIENVLGDVKNAIDRVNTFPDDAETPVIYKRERTDPAADIMISGDVDLNTLKEFAKKAEQQLLAKKNISKVVVSGYPNEEIEIAIREKALDAYQLTFADIARVVQGSNVELTGGNIEMGNTKITIRAENKVYYAEQLENIIVQTSSNGTNILLKDVADIKNQWADVPQREFYNGKPAAKLQIMSRLSEDIITTAGEAKAFIAEFNAENTIVEAFLLRDGSIGIQQRTDLLVKNGLVGFLLVLLLLGLFLKPRIAFWVALSIPISIAGMFIIMPFSTVNINMLSLFGLILVIGILVDDGVVIAENIFQKYEKGIPARQAAIEGVMEVLPSVISAVITTCWFFMLFFLIEGQMGDFMSNIAFVVITTLLFSLIEGFFILPAHIAHSKDLQQGGKKNIMERTSTAFFDFLKNNIYGPILRFCLNNKTIALSTGIVTLVLCVNLVKGGIVKVTFFPSVDQDNVVVALKLPAGTTDNVTKATLSRIEKAAWELNETLSEQRTDGQKIVQSIARSIAVSPNEGQLFISLLDGETRNMLSSDFGNMLRDKVGKVYEAESLTYGQKSIFGAAVQVGFVGEDMNELRKAKDAFKAILETDKRLKNVQDNDQKGGLEFHINLLPKAKSLGIDLATIIRQIRQGYFGYEIQRLQRGTDEVKVWLRYTDQERASFSDLLNMKIRVGQNTYPLKELIDLEQKRVALKIAHVNNQAKMEVSASLNDPNASATEIFNHAKDVIIPELLAQYPSVHVIYEGQSERAGDTTASMKRWLPIILLLVFFTVVLTFRSFLQAAIVLLLIPFAFIGVVSGHWLHGLPISMLSLFGILAVAGVVINDSLVLVSTMNRLLKDGMDFKDAVYQASISRFRPILLTSVTTVAGLLPIVLETSLQAQFVIPMAVSLAYGLLSATFIMLLMLPPLLMVVNNIRLGWHWLWEGEKLQPREVEPSVLEEVEGH